MHAHQTISYVQRALQRQQPEVISRKLSVGRSKGVGKGCQAPTGVTEAVSSSADGGPLILSALRGFSLAGHHDCRPQCIAELCAVPAGHHSSGLPPHRVPHVRLCHQQGRHPPGRPARERPGGQHLQKLRGGACPEHPAVRPHAHLVASEPDSLPLLAARRILSVQGTSLRCAWYTCGRLKHPL